MSEELYGSVLGQNLLQVMNQVKADDHSTEYFSALEDFEQYNAAQERKLAEPTDYEGIDPDGKKE